MKCPKCSFNNPSGTRYCQHCGSDMIPPIPQADHGSGLVSSRRNPFRSILLFFIMIFVFVGLIMTVVLLTFSHGSSKVETIVQEEASPAEIPPVPETDSNNLVTPYTYDYFSDFVDLDKRTVTLPESGMVLEFPEYSDYQFEYDPERESMIFEIVTPDDTVMTIASSQLHASPFTKSEAEASQRQGLYYKIEGDEDVYYYMLPPSGSTVSGTIIDCNYNRSTTITVFSRLEETGGQSSQAVSEYSSQTQADSQLQADSSSQEPADDNGQSSAETEVIEESGSVVAEEGSAASGLQSAEMDNEAALPDPSLQEDSSKSYASDDSSQTNSAQNQNPSASQNGKDSSSSRPSLYLSVTLHQLEAILDSAGIQ